MSKRESLLYIVDILDSINAIEEYLENTDYETFCNDRKTYAATIREFIIIGEAINKIMDILQTSYPEYPWRILKDFRNFIIHEYFGVNPQIVYDAARQELEEVKNIMIQLKETSARQSL